MFRLFADHYDFGMDDPYVRVPDIQLMSGNGVQKHRDVEYGITEYSTDWECVGYDDERRRGDDKLYLVDGEHYVWCSITGMESAGNSIRFSSEAPTELMVSVVRAVFERITSRHVGDFLGGVTREELLDGEEILSDLTSVKMRFSDEVKDREAHDEELANAVVEMVGRYQDAETVEDIVEAVDLFMTARTELYRKYTDFQPSLVSEAINNGDVVIQDGWMGPESMGAGETHLLIMHEEFGDREYFIEAGSMFGEERDEVRLLVTVGDEDTYLRSEQYDTADELVGFLNEMMENAPSDLDERYQAVC